MKRKLQPRDLVAGTRSLQHIRVIDLARSDGKNQVKSDPILFDGGEEDLATTGVASGGNEAIIDDVGTALLPPIVRCMNPPAIVFVVGWCQFPPVFLHKTTVHGWKRRSN